MVWRAAAAVPRSSHEVAPQTDGELTTAEAPPGAAPLCRSAALLGAGAGALCVAAALLCWAGADPAASAAGDAAISRLAFGVHRMEDVFSERSLTSSGLLQGSGECSGYHEGCMETRCCKEPTDECFKKDDYWAQCLKTCLNTDGDPWSCEVLSPAAQKGGQPGCTEKGENCLESKCCADPEAQCFMKDEGWAGCRLVCEEGAHDPDGPDKTPWSCVELSSTEEEEDLEAAEDLEEGEEDLKASTDLEEGEEEEPGVELNETEREAAEEAARRKKEEEEKHRKVKLAPCNWLSENCNESKCCNDPGMMCYAKNEYWAECLEACDAGENDTAGPDALPWSCKELGMRTAPAVVVQETAEEVVACSVRGEDCARSRCCEETGYKCYEKNSSFSGCRTECKPGLYDPTGTDWKPWTCVLKSEANPLASQGKASGQGGSGAGRVFGVALAAIQEEVEEIDMKQMMART